MAPIAPIASIAPELKFRKANVLDIPLIFNLFLEGSVDGAFADRYLIATGPLKLFLWVVNAVFHWPDCLRKNTPRAQLHVIHKGEQDVGFAQLTHGTAPDGGATLTLALLAVAKDHQNQKFGTWAVATIIREMPASTILEVYCTKYSRAMQRLLHKQQFARDKMMVNNLSRFSLRKAE